MMYPIGVGIYTGRGRLSAGENACPCADTRRCRLSSMHIMNLTSHNVHLQSPWRAALEKMRRRALRVAVALMVMIRRRMERR